MDNKKKLEEIKKELESELKIIKNKNSENLEKISKLENELSEKNR